MMKLDTTVLVETPEGIDLQAETVNVIPRALAYSLDFLLRAIVIITLSIILAFFGESGQGEGGQGIVLVIFFILEWFYPVYFEVFRNGQTIGKKAMKIRVVNHDLTPIRFGASLTRNLLRAADFLPFCYVVGIATTALSSKGQRLGDLAAGTLVVYVHEETDGTASLDTVKAIAPTEQIPADVQAAFIALSLNRGDLSQARQQEIAEILRPKIAKQYSDALAYIRGVGKWLLGGQ